MFDEKIKELKASIDSLSTTIADKTAQVKNALEADDLEKARTIKNEIDTAKEELKTAKADLELFEATKNSGGAENKKGHEVKGEDMNYRDKVNAFLHSKGTVVNEGLRFDGKDEVLIAMNEVTPVAPTTDGVKKADTTKITSEELVTTPIREIKTTVDLISIVAETVSQIKVNTTNAAIADVLKSFTAKTVANVDDIKKILNVDLDPAYDVAFVVSQSFYQILDTLKDVNGRYLLQDSITAVTGKVLLDKPVFVLSDEILGASGEAKAFVGDVKRGVLFADRKDLGLRWADNEIYGQYLQAVLRFGVKKVDAKAGYFVTFTPSEA